MTSATFWSFNFLDQIFSCHSLDTRNSQFLQRCLFSPFQCFSFLTIFVGITFSFFSGIDIVFTDSVTNTCVIHCYFIVFTTRHFVTISVTSFCLVRTLIRVTINYMKITCSKCAVQLNGSYENVVSYVIFLFFGKMKKVTKVNYMLLLSVSVFGWVKHSAKLKAGMFRGSTPDVFLEKGVLKICRKLIGELPCRSVISTKSLSNFIEITLRYVCSPLNLLHNFRTTFSKNTSGVLLLYAAQE